MSAPSSSSAPEQRSARRWRRSWVIDVLIVVGIYLAVSTWRTKDALETGNRAPALQLRGLDGGRVSLQELRGKPVLLHFWATWCSACRLELSSLNALNQDLPKDAVLLSVVADSSDAEHVRRFARENEIRYPILLADDSVLRTFNVSAFPTNYYIDREGRVSDVTVGVSLRLVMWLRLRWAG